MAICPLLREPCKKEACEWWYKRLDSYSCVMTTIPSQFTDVRNVVARLSNKFVEFEKNLADYINQE
jgi:hypothetical protein